MIFFEDDHLAHRKRERVRRRHRCRAPSRHQLDRDRRGLPFSGRGIFLRGAAIGLPGEVIVLVLGDFDPGGWLTGHTFVVHLARYGVLCPRSPVFLVRPEVFTEEELRLFSRPLSAKDGRVEEWLAASGGIAGEARGIHADWLHPAERVLWALEASLPSLSIPIQPE